MATALALPAGAHAADGVNYDPGSPAGKEYAIPLASGRADGAGTENQQAAASVAFGVGIRPPGGAGGAGKGKGATGNGRTGGSGANGSGGGSGASGGSGTDAAHASPALTKRILDASKPPGTTLLTLGMALAVLLAAALLAVALRRRPQHQPRH